MTNRNLIIYVVDDDLSVRRALKLLLKAHGFIVEAFSSAADFLAFKHPKVTSCLILDLRLPHMDGLALQEALKVRGLTIPIIFISGHGSIPKSVKAMRGGRRFPTQTFH
ncbi:MAG: response regulator [Candidatus Aceula meridiana]|nr:response regulator [Candidatus Aceula meridiana]